MKFKTPNEGSFPTAIVTGPDGKLWFTEQFADAIGSGLGAGTVPPVVTSIIPASGAIAGGTVVTVTGTGFTGVTGVFFGGFPATSFTFVSARQVIAVSPAGGATDVVVDTAAGSSTPGTSDQFSYIGPFVNGMSPGSGTTAGGDTVTLTGSGFTGVTQVNFGTASATFTFISDSNLTAISPPGTGVVDVTVTTPAGTSAAGFTFFYQQPKVTPSVTGINPGNGAAGGGDTVTISGSGFSSVSVVNFGAAPAASFSFISDTQIIAVSPPGSGMVDITVQTAAGTSPTGAGDQFTFAAPPPAVIGLNPNSGPAKGASSVDVTGSGFTGVTAVNFGPNAASTFSFVSDGEVTAVSPAGSATVDLTVVTPAGTSTTGFLDQFTYNSAPPAVTSVDPVTGSADGGDTVTIDGTGFTGITGVTFGGTPAASFNFVSDGQVTAVSPAGSGTVDITITTPGGVSPAISTDQFTYY
jgi:hypothetical protein